MRHATLRQRARTGVVVVLRGGVVQDTGRI